MAKSLCLIDGCNRDAVSRGLCSSCYQSANNLVKSQKTTWEYLEEQGLCLSGSGRRPNALTAAFKALASASSNGVHKEEDAEEEAEAKPGKSKAKSKKRRKASSSAD